MKINPLPVLHDLVDEDFFRVGRPHPTGDRCKPQAFSCLEASFARNDLVDIFVVQILDGDWLQDAELLNRC